MMMYADQRYYNNNRSPAIFSPGQQTCVVDNHVSNPPAPYGGSNHCDNPPAPYGGSSHGSNPSAPYGGSSARSKASQKPPADQPGSFNGGFYPVQYSQQQYPQEPQRYVDSKRQDSDEEERPAKENRGSARSMFKNILRENVLYMMIVNMPSEKEIEEAKKALAEQQYSPTG